MRILFRANKSFMNEVRADLQRPHEFADERVGFIAVRAAQGLNSLVLLAETYHPIIDTDYLRDPSVGAMLGSEAIRKALEIALFHPVGVLHVHMHFHSGEPRFSRTDLREQPKFVPDFFKVRRTMPHGAVVLSEDAAYGRVWLSSDHIVEITEFNFVGKTFDIQTKSDTKKWIEANGHKA
jgi:hypothetical protein